MRIGIEAQRLLRPKKHGMDLVALELVRALQQLDNRHEFYVLVRPDTDQSCAKSAGNVHFIEVPGYNYVHWEQMQLPRYVKRLGLDLLHCTANTAPLQVGIPMVLTLHDVIFMERRQGPNTATAYQQWGNAYRRLVVPRVVRPSRRVVTVSHDERGRILRTLALPEDKVEVVYNGVGKRFVQPPTPELIASVREQYQLAKPYLFFLGNTDPKKNMANVVDAFTRFAERVPDVQLVVADTDVSVVEALLNGLGKSELLSRFVFPGYIAGSVLPAFYAEASVFLYPSLRESFGLPILEAMACGVPVVTSNVAAMPEVAGNAAFLVDPTQPEAIAEAIWQAYSNPGLRQEKIKAGLKRPELFSWEQTAQSMLNVYENAV